MVARRLLLISALAGCLCALLPAQPGIGGAPVVWGNGDAIRGIAGLTDVIIEVEITDTKTPQGEPDPQHGAVAGGNGFSGKYGGSMGEITVEVEKVLKGNFKPGEVVTLPLMFQPMFERGEGKVTFRGWNLQLQQGQRYILLLQRTKLGYSLLREPQPVDQCAKIEALLAALPLQVSTPKVEGILFFGEKNPVTVTVKNVSDQPQRLSNISPSGFYLGKKLDNFLQVMLVPPPAGDKVEPLPSFKAPVVLPAKTEKTFTLYVSPAQPQAWQMFDAESCLITPVAMRAQISYQKPAENGNGPVGNESCQSPLVNAFVGFPLPKDAAR